MPKVQVKVMSRPIPGAPDQSFHGYGAAGFYWANGTTEAEVTAEQLAELKRVSEDSNAPLTVTELLAAPVQTPAQVPAPSLEAPKPAEQLKAKR